MKTEIVQLLELYNAKNPTLPYPATPDYVNIVMAKPEDGAAKNAAARLVAQGGNDRFINEVTLKYNRIPAPPVPDLTIACTADALANKRMWGILGRLWGEKFGDDYSVNPPPGSPFNIGIGESNSWDRKFGECPIYITGLKYIGDESGVTEVFTITFVEGTDDIDTKLTEHFAAIGTKTDLSAANGELDGFTTA